MAALSAVAILFVALYWLALAVLNGVGLLPPPQLANNLCIDQKLTFLRTHDIEPPTLLVEGSSVAWRGIDSEVLQEASGGRIRPLNGAFCGQKLNQTEFTARYLLAHYPSVRSLVVVFAPQDMTECATTSSRVFEPNDVDNFVFRHDVEFEFYLKYFDPLILAKNVVILRQMRDGKLPTEVVNFDRYGDAPDDTNITHDLTYGALPPLDSDCVASLHRLARDIQAQGLNLIAVTSPISPIWKTRYDPSGTAMQELSDDVQRALAGTGAVFWDANRDFPMASGDFVDAIHIRWSAAKALSRALVLATGLDGEPSQHTALSPQ